MLMIDSRQRRDARRYEEDGQAGLESEEGASRLGSEEGAKYKVKVRTMMLLPAVETVLWYL